MAQNPVGAVRPNGAGLEIVPRTAKKKKDPTWWLLKSAARVAPVAVASYYGLWGGAKGGSYMYGKLLPLTVEATIFGLVKYGTSIFFDCMKQEFSGIDGWTLGKSMAQSWALMAAIFSATYGLTPYLPSVVTDVLAIVGAWSAGWSWIEYCFDAQGRAFNAECEKWINSAKSNSWLNAGAKHTLNNLTYQDKKALFWHAVLSMDVQKDSGVPSEPKEPGVLNGINVLIKKFQNTFWNAALTITAKHVAKERKKHPEISLENMSKDDLQKMMQDAVKKEYAGKDVHALQKIRAEVTRRFTIDADLKNLEKDIVKACGKGRVVDKEMTQGP